MLMCIPRLPGVRTYVGDGGKYKRYTFLTKLDPNGRQPELNCIQHAFLSSSLHLEANLLILLQVARWKQQLSIVNSQTVRAVRTKTTIPWLADLDLAAM